MMRRLSFILFSAVFSCLIVASVSATVIHIPADQPTIAQGLMAAGWNDTLMIAAGTYYEWELTIDRPLTMQGATGNPADVIIDAQSNAGLLSAHGIDEEYGNVILKDITFANGFDGVAPGISLGDCHAQIGNCVFRGMYSMHEYAAGGAIHVGNYATLDVADCLFEDNFSRRYGGAIYVIHATLTLRNSVFRGNTSNGSGSAVFVKSSVAEISYCLFIDNFSIASTFEANSNNTDLHHCSFVDNRTGLYFNMGGATLANCIITGTQSQGAVGTYGINLLVECCDVWGNPAGDWTWGIAGMGDQNGNLCEDPLFCLDLNPMQPYTLQDNSPCLGDNNPDCGNIGAFGVGCFSTVTEESSFSALKSLY